MPADAICRCHPKGNWRFTQLKLKSACDLIYRFRISLQASINCFSVRKQAITKSALNFFVSSSHCRLQSLLVRRNVFMSNLKQFAGSFHESLGSFGMNNFTAFRPPSEKLCLRQTKHAASIWPIQQSHSAYLTSLNSHAQLFPFFLPAPVTNVEAIEGQQAHLYCPMTTQNADKINMVLWFKDDVGVPIYR